MTFSPPTGSSSASWLRAGCSDRLFGHSHGVGVTDISSKMVGAPAKVTEFATECPGLL
jgi:hypothetical protein